MPLDEATVAGILADLRNILGRLDELRSSMISNRAETDTRFHDVEVRLRSLEMNMNQSSGNHMDILSNRKDIESLKKFQYIQSGAFALIVLMVKLFIH